MVLIYPLEEAGVQIPKPPIQTTNQPCLRGQRTCGPVVHFQGGAWVEAVPAEPQRKGAQHDQRQVVRLKLLWIHKAPLPGPQHDGAGQAADAAREVDNTGASKVHVAHVQDAGNPAPTPGPCHHHGVDEACHEEGVGGIGGALHALCNCSAHDGGACCAEGPLEEPAQHGALAAFPVAGDWRDHPRGGILAVEIPAEEAGGADKAIAVLRAVGKGPSQAPPAQGAHTHVHQVLHQDVGRVLGAAAACLQHCEAGVHEHHLCARIQDSLARWLQHIEFVFTEAIDGMFAEPQVLWADMACCLDRVLILQTNGFPTAFLPVGRTPPNKRVDRTERQTKTPATSQKIVPPPLHKKRKQRKDGGPILNPKIPRNPPPLCQPPPIRPTQFPPTPIPKASRRQRPAEAQPRAVQRPRQALVHLLQLRHLSRYRESSRWSSSVSFGLPLKQDSPPCPPEKEERKRARKKERKKERKRERESPRMKKPAPGAPSKSDESPLKGHTHTHTHTHTWPHHGSPSMREQHPVPARGHIRAHNAHTCGLSKLTKAPLFGGTLYPKVEGGENNIAWPQSPAQKAKKPCFPKSHWQVAWAAKARGSLKWGVKNWAHLLGDPQAQGRDFRGKTSG